MTTGGEQRGVWSGRWFRPQRYGRGAIPTTWRGWAATILFGAAIMLVFAEFDRPVDVLFALSLAAVFEQLARRKTDGEWRWRRGDEFA